MVALTMSAITYQDKVSITLDDGTYMHALVVGESNELSTGLNNGYVSDIQNIDEMPLAIYALYNSVKYSTFLMKSYENQQVGFKTTNATTYHLYFDDVVGTVNLYDRKLGAAVPVTEGGDYEFTIEAGEKNSLISDRFVLNYSPKPEICHRYKLLQITDCVGMTVKVLNMDGTATSIADTNITSAYQEINLAGLATGQYKVEWNSKTLIIKVVAVP